MLRGHDTFWCSLIVFAGILLVLNSGCTKSGMMEGVGGDEDRATDTEEAIYKEEPAEEDIDSFYDLEREIPEDDDLVDPDELEEEFVSIPSDTISVEDIIQERPMDSDYGLGYRIQVFASGDLERAKGIKEKAIADFGFAVYIEYEDDLYKVRIGDFGTRESAAKARADLTEIFPDCWIVQTTIKK